MQHSEDLKNIFAIPLGVDDVTIELLDFRCGTWCQFAANIIHYLSTLSCKVLWFLAIHEMLVIFSVGLLHLLYKVFPSFFFCGCYLLVVVSLICVVFIGKKGQGCTRNPLFGSTLWSVSNCLLCSLTNYFNNIFVHCFRMVNFEKCNQNNFSLLVDTVDSVQIFD